MSLLHNMPELSRLLVLGVFRSDQRKQRVKSAKNEGGLNSDNLSRGHRPLFSTVGTYRVIS